MKKQQNSDVYSDGNYRDCSDGSKDCGKDCSNTARNSSGKAKSCTKNGSRNCGHENCSDEAERDCR